MMDSDRSGSGGGAGLFLPGALGGLPGMPGGGGGGGAGQLSPYLNFDPSYLQSTPEYLMDTEASRGGMEKSFTAIGSSVCIGGCLGGVYGVYDGVRQTALGGLQGKLRRTRITNYTIKSGTSVSNALGSIAVSYSLIYCLLGLAVDQGEYVDEGKSITSGTLTGLLFKSTSGLKKCAKGGALGFGLATLWAFGLKKQENVQNFI